MKTIRYLKIKKEITVWGFKPIYLKSFINGIKKSQHRNPMAWRLSACLHIFQIENRKHKFDQ